MAFPTSPTDGQTYTSASGTSYTFKAVGGSGYWIAASLTAEVASVAAGSGGGAVSPANLAAAALAGFSFPIKGLGASGAQSALTGQISGGSNSTGHGVFGEVDNTYGGDAVHGLNTGGGSGHAVAGIQQGTGSGDAVNALIASQHTGPGSSGNFLYAAGGNGSAILATGVGSGLGDVVAAKRSGAGTGHVISVLHTGTGTGAGIISTMKGASPASGVTGIVDAAHGKASNGVVGNVANNLDGVGVYGSISGGGNGHGVQGALIGTGSGDAVNGTHNGGSTGNGVHGVMNGTSTGAALKGDILATHSGSGDAVWGVVASNSTGNGVRGTYQGSGSGNGVRGEVTGGTGHAIAGYNTGSSGYAGYFNGAVVGTTFTQASDASLKRDVADIPLAISKIFFERLRFVDYVQLQDETGATLGQQSGLIAQEVRAIVEEVGYGSWLIGELPSGKLSLNYVGLMMIMMKGMQAIVQDQNATIAAIKAHLNM